MSLADFMQQLQNQEASGELIFSKSPEDSVHIVPPDNNSVRIIVPETSMEVSNKPAKIKLKLNNNTVEPVQPIQQSEPIPAQPKVPDIPRELVQQVVAKPAEITEEDLFIKSGTEDSKRTIWMEYFAQAKASKKHNPIVDKMKIGRFTITPDNKVLILPDYDVVNKDPDDIIKDSWF